MTTLDSPTRTPALLTLRPTEPANAELLHAVWAASQDLDDPASRPAGGWWSVADWASTTRVLVVGGEMIGFAAVRFVAGDDLAEGRLALLPRRRSAPSSNLLLGIALELARAAGARRLRLAIPAAASWAADAARAAGFESIRASHVMLRPAGSRPIAAPDVPGVRVRRLRDGEEPVLLAALNRAWDGTWGFRPISPDVLARDLRGQRDGMLVAVDAADESQIVATCHAIFDATGRNPDGGPYAWISNLTTDPAWRGRGLARMMLAAGETFLRARGAGSVALGVDGGNAVPLALYRASGFDTVSTLGVWEHHGEDSRRWLDV